jgi:hypothetical protein
LREQKTLGILTNDFRLFYDLAESLKSMGVQFTSLAFGRPVPQHVGVVLTSEEELGSVFFEPKIPVGERVKRGIRRGLAHIHGAESLERLVVGVDPGEMPGVAVLAQDRVLEMVRGTSPEDAAAKILEIVEDYSADFTVVRIGHGDEDNRNRILRLVGSCVDRCEIVDEATTSSPSTTDMDSAAAIARTRGRAVTMLAKVTPRPGKVRDLQRKSRIESAGSVTLSKEEAEAVAEGRTTMADAIRMRKRG